MTFRHGRNPPVSSRGPSFRQGAPPGRPLDRLRTGSPAFGGFFAYDCGVILTLVVAADEGNVIGGGNTLLWSLPDDFARMKAITMGKPLLMGRKTHQSIGRVLPGRRNIVITRDAERVLPGAEHASSLESAIAMAKAGGAEEAIVFGGGEIYRAALPLADRVRLTRVHAHFQGDTVFPPLPGGEWKRVLGERHDADDRHAHAFTFEDYERLR